MFPLFEPPCCKQRHTPRLCRYVIHISDLNPHSLSANGWLEDVSKVEKYVMSDEEYNKRANTVRAHKQMKRKVTILPPPLPLQWINWTQGGKYKNRMRPYSGLVKRCGVHNTGCM